MAQLTIPVNDFNLNSTWSCWYRYDVNNNYAYSQGQTSATEATKTVTFSYELPSGSTVTSAKVHSKWSGTLSGIRKKTVNGVTPDDDGFVVIDGVNASATSHDVVFAFVAERHDVTECVGGIYFNDLDYWPDNQTTPEYVSHSSSAVLTEVYLVIDYEEGEDEDDTGSSDGTEGGNDTGSGDDTEGGGDAESGDNIPSGTTSQLIVPADGFNLVSKYTCYTRETCYYTAAGSLVDRDFSYYTNTPNTVSGTVHFDYTIPDGVTVRSAKVCATLSSPLYGAQLSTINGVYANTGATNQVGINLDEGASSVDVNFVFRSRSVAHDHSSSSDYDESWVYDEPSANNCDIRTRLWKVDHEGRIDYTNVYLLIEYTTGSGSDSGSGSTGTTTELIAYTDPNPIAGVTYVKAIHITDLQINVNLLRTARDMGDYKFTTIIPSETSIGDWRNHILEIRNAIDEIGAPHEEWIAFSGNRPQLNILMQLRNVVATIGIA